ncbi:MAG: class I SAM-dependent methyltransferase [Oscillospiraceae bacterium]|nr:class I SAM-dependent methyltransferase [Oscillospiraceae bacterium]
MQKSDVITFFDNCAPSWDAEMVKSDKIINRILDQAFVGPGMDVLDVACGTGVMFPYYLQRGVASVTGIDISPEMAKIAAAKTADEPRITVICGDVEEAEMPRKFDRIVVYNAFPHFPDPKKLIRVLAGLLKPEGRLTIAHGKSRLEIDAHHMGPASKVSNGLMPADRLKALLDPWLDVEIMVSTDEMYQLSGVLRDPQEHIHCAVPHAHHDHAHAHSHEPLSGTAMSKLLVLMKYMVDHNEAHAQELASLADQLSAAGETAACAQVMDALVGFDVANAKLDAVRSRLSRE